MRSSVLAALAVVSLCAGATALPATSAGCDATGADGDALPALACNGPSFDAAPLSIRCNALVDARGREVRLHGVNARIDGVFDVALDGGRIPLEPIPPFGTDDARRMRAVGFDSLRLPIQWSGVEPTESGGFDDAYLARVKAVLDLAHEADLLVLVDFHQDAYSKEIGEDGAPYWAIVPPPPQKLQGPLVDLDQRRLSKPVLDAFDTFFGTSPDGARLRARFTKMAAHVAARFADHPAVVGFEIYNEPMATAPRLRAFHEEVLPALRAAAPRKLVFFEPPAIRNLVDFADVPDAPLGPGTVYSPHVYTAAFASDEVRAAVTEDQVRRSYEAARVEADAWATPLVVTEIGFPPAHPRFAEYMGWHARLADELGASTFFWVWKEMSQGSWGLYDYDAAGVARERPAVVRALTRVRLEACAGRVESIERPTPEILRVTFRGLDTEREHRMSLGTAFVAESASCDGTPLPLLPGGAPSTVTMSCGGPGRHVLEVKVRKS